MTYLKNWKLWALCISSIIVGSLLQELEWLVGHIGFAEVLYRYQTLATGVFASLAGCFIIIAANIQSKGNIIAAKIQSKDNMVKYDAELKINKHKAASIMLGKAINRQKQIEMFLDQDYLIKWLHGKLTGELISNLPEAISYKNHDISNLSGIVISLILDSNDRLKLIKNRLDGNKEGDIKKWNLTSNDEIKTLGEWLHEPFVILHQQLLILIHELDKYTETELPNKLRKKIDKYLNAPTSN